MKTEEKSIKDRELQVAVSADGTAIGYYKSGDGSPLLLVHGLLGDHSRWDALRHHLEQHFTVYAMDRRGRGASGDNQNYDIAREFEDVAAVVDAIAQTHGSSVDVYGSSGGACYAVGAAKLTTNIMRLVLFEPPTAGLMQLLPADLVDGLNTLLESGDREGVLRTAYREVVRLSEAEIEKLRAQPVWQNRIAAAHTVPRELGIPPERLFDPEQAASVTVPSLILVGDATPGPFQASSKTVASALPDARVSILEGQHHGAEMFAPDVVAGAILPFLSEQQ
jgi:pimeloyl-ACP methyl ester carboxylesterase